MFNEIRQTENNGEATPSFSMNSATIVECSPHSISRLLALGKLFSSFRKEREQVLAHSELFIGTAWYRKVKPHHWCEAVAIRREDSPGYVEAIATNLTGKHPTAFTLAAIEKTSLLDGSQCERGWMFASQSSFNIAGYIYCHLPDDSAETLVVGHLKVDTQYQRRGVGSMLMTAGQIHASQRGWRCSKARLAVLAENRPARN